MKNQITLIILCLFCICTIQIQNSSAQTNNVFAPTITDFFNSCKFKEAVVTTGKSKYTGSQYVDNEFHKGSIITSDSIVFSGIALRYNNYKDVMEFKKDENIVYEIPSQLPIMQVKIDGVVYERKAYKLKGQLKHRFFQRLTNGEIALFRQQRIVLEPAKMASIYNASKLPNFKPKNPECFLQNNKSNEIKIISNKKELLKLLSDKKDQLSGYIKKNKLKIKKEDDFIKIVNYYNNI